MVAEATYQWIVGTIKPKTLVILPEISDAQTGPLLRQPKDLNPEAGGTSAGRMNLRGTDILAGVMMEVIPQTGGTSVGRMNLRETDIATGTGKIAGAMREVILQTGDPQ